MLTSSQDIPHRHPIFCIFLCFSLAFDLCNHLLPKENAWSFIHILTHMMLCHDQDPSFVVVALVFVVEYRKVTLGL